MKTQYFNGVRVNMEENEGIARYETEGRGVQFKMYKNSQGRLVLSGEAYGETAADMVKKMFPRMELRPYGSAGDDDGGPADFPCYRFDKIENF